ncbi:MAG TPA: alcohol dehydrogenase catalytic domain-containing protein [Gaiellaceae bacterium]|nr:alcohol dehydrogenase catalytic domain-containing protein [Gaiellaceae bacterium]
MDRGVVLSELGRFAVEEIELAEPGPREARVRLEASGVCHSDLHVVRTGFGHPLPVLLGHEGAGVVEAVGEGVEQVAPGDRVVIGWRSPCGECRWCLRGATELCRTPPMAVRRVRAQDGRYLMGVFRAGTFATRTVLHGDSLVRLPAELPAEEACLLGCAVATGVCSVLKTAEVWEGARVGVIGCGAVGLCVVQGARIAGAAEIHALDLDERKLEAAGRFGATHTGADDATRLDFVFDVVGRPETVAQGIGMLGHAGTLVYIGLPNPGAVAELPLDYAFDRRVRILVSHGGDHVPAEDFPRLALLAAEGRLDLAGLVTKRIALDEVAVAFEEMEAGDVIRSVIVL